MHNTLDIAFKVSRGPAFVRKEEFEPHMTINERIQHLILTLTFFTLAWSGFALKFPDSIIAIPFHFFNDGSGIRRWVHRGAAATFVVLMAYHLYYLFGTRRGRTLFKAMLPRVKDGLDAVTVMLRYVFRWSGPPQVITPIFLPGKSRILGASVGQHDNDRDRHDPAPGQSHHCSISDACFQPRGHHSFLGSSARGLRHYCLARLLDGPGPRSLSHELVLDPGTTNPAKKSRHGTRRS